MFVFSASLEASWIPNVQLGKEFHQIFSKCEYFPAELQIAWISFYDVSGLKQKTSWCWVVPILANYLTYAILICFKFDCYLGVERVWGGLKIMSLFMWMWTHQKMYRLAQHTAKSRKICDCSNQDGRKIELFSGLCRECKWGETKKVNMI